MKNVRIERLNDAFQEEIMQIILEEVKDELELAILQIYPWTVVTSLDVVVILTLSPTIYAVFAVHSGQLL